MADLWIPGEAMTPVCVGEMPKGSLVLMSSHARNSIPFLAVRFDIDSRRLLLSITNFGRGIGSTMDFTDSEETGYRVDLPFSIEADLSKPVSSARMEDPKPGQLVAGNAGVALMADLQLQRRFPSVDPVSITDWIAGDRDTLGTVFGGWRLRIRVGEGQTAIYDPLVGHSPSIS
jgi:hypothetical protein